MDRWILLSNGADIVDVSPFQFSHVFSDMDRSFREAMPGDISSFQFSHVFSDMDREAVTSRRKRGLACSI